MTTKCLNSSSHRILNIPKKVEVKQMKLTKNHNENMSKICSRLDQKQKNKTIKNNFLKMINK